MSTLYVSFTLINTPVTKHLLAGYIGGECREKSVRMTAVDEGRFAVEVCLSGRWGSVCGDHWDSSDSLVVCKQHGWDDGGKDTGHFALAL